MSRPGTATDAARIFGLSLSAFSAQRTHSTYVLDVVEGTLSPAGLRQANRATLAGLHLVAPVVHGQIRPGARWEYDLEAIRSARAASAE